ncbi:extracellular solute-binding protein [Paenibacillus ehimensis]|uniref:extracellular solute-binding protein n=1 Tax=Paenibacillus ehimensis TaxID=79264 RepID=UPI0004700DEB|nr:extracellular solute-binding protein [Paenibacillus ehimensis]
MNKALPLVLGCTLTLTLAACSGGVVGRGEGRAKDASQPSATAQEAGNPSAKGGKKTVVLATSGSSDYFTAAKKKYEEKHPNIEIRIKDYRGEGRLDEQQYEKIIARMNTELLSGKEAADLIVLDPFPVSEYVNKKMLANLSEMMEKDLSFPKDQVYGNLLDGLKLNGSLYYMPMSFYMDFLWKTTTLRWWMR